jgi:hypothetical protein
VSGAALTALLVKVGNAIADALEAEGLDVGYSVIFVDGNVAVAASNIAHPSLVQLLRKTADKVELGIH